MIEVSPNDNCTANFVQETDLLKNSKLFFCIALMKTPHNWQSFHEYLWGVFGRWYV